MNIMFLAICLYGIYISVYVCYQHDSRTNYCKISEFVILMDYAIYSYITIRYGDTARVFL